MRCRDGRVTPLCLLGLRASPKCRRHQPRGDASTRARGLIVDYGDRLPPWPVVHRAPLLWCIIPPQLTVSSFRFALGSCFQES